MSTTGPGGSSVSSQLAAFFARLTAADLPESVIEDARWRFVDFIGLCVAGSRLPQAAPILAVARSNGGAGEATAVVSGDRLPATAVAWVNASVGHGTDYDDFHGPSAVHIGTVAVPAALAMAERMGADGRACLLACVAGAEVGLRINVAAPPQRFHERGLHGTGMAGPFVGAGVAAKLMGLDAGQTAHALGIAGSQSAGLLQGLIDGSWVKQLHPGFAAQSGILAAQLARHSFTGPLEVIEGRMGYLRSFLYGDDDLLDVQRVVADLGDRWLLPETTFKQFPTGAWNQASMEAIGRVMADEGLKPDDLERVDCFVAPPCIGIVCEPREAKIHPQSPYHMKFSLPYSVAIVAVRGTLRAEDFDEETLHDPTIASLAARVFCEPDASMLPDRLGARVRVTTRHARVMELEIPVMLGGLERPPTVDEHREKFLRNAGPTLGDAGAEALLAAVEEIWDRPDVSEIVALTIPGR